MTAARNGSRFDQFQAERRGGAGGREEAQEAGSQEYDGSAERDGGIIEVNLFRMLTTLIGLSMPVNLRVPIIDLLPPIGGPIFRFFIFVLS